MGAFGRTIAYLAFVATVVVSEPSDSVKILKCCGDGEELLRSNDDPNSLPRCRPTSNKWKPLIYSPIQRTLNGQQPANWRILSGKWPECDVRTEELIHVPYRIANPFILVDDGNVMLPTASNNDSRIPAGHYCADSNALLVCVQRKSPGNHAAATMRPRVRRCCGENATFHERG